jgi:hypothetical protein
MGITSAGAWEQWCLDEFILESASRQGHIDCIEVSDERILAFAGTHDLNLAGEKFAKALGRPDAVAGLFNGSALPIWKGHKPTFVRLLIFACWAQVTALRSDQERDIRELLSHRLGWRCPIQLIGLRRMWEHLRFWLAAEWGIDLRLPDGPHKQVGYTIRLAFPTWRDIQGLRRMRDDLPESIVMSPRRTAERIHAFASSDDRSPAFCSRFNEWHDAVRISDPLAAELPFGRVWHRIVAETIADGTIEVNQDDFGDLHISIRSITVSDGAREVHDIGPPEMELLAPRISATMNAREVAYLASQGFGRWSSSSRNDATAVLVTGKALKSMAEEAADLGRRRIGASRWYLVPTEFEAPPTPDLTADPLLRRTDGIRTAGGLLGLWPFTPRFLLLGPEAPTLQIDGDTAPFARNGNDLTFTPGTWVGRCRVELQGQQVDSFQLVGEAVEHSNEMLKSYDEGSSIAEDGPVFDTCPMEGQLRSRARRKSGTRSSDRQLALQEAVYAKIARGIQMGDLVKLTNRALEGLEDKPSPWDVARAFVDAGWLEPCAVRRAPAREFTPRRTRLRVSREDKTQLLLLDGLAGRRTCDRVKACASSMKLEVVDRPGLSQWALPTITIVAEREAWPELAERTALSIENPSVTRSPNAKHWSSVTTAMGYQTTGVWNERLQHFEGSADNDARGVARMDRSAADGPAIYRIGALAEAEFFVSPNLAIMKHAMVASKTKPYIRLGDTLVRTGTRVHLPAAWGRWLRMRALVAPGPSKIDGKWTYAYPVDDASMDAMRGLCEIVGPSVVPLWAAPLAASRRSDLPFISKGTGVFDARRGS